MNAIAQFPCEGGIAAATLSPPRKRSAAGGGDLPEIKSEKQEMCDLYCEKWNRVLLSRLIGSSPGNAKGGESGMARREFHAKGVAKERNSAA